MIACDARPLLDGWDLTGPFPDLGEGIRASAKSSSNSRNARPRLPARARPKCRHNAHLLGWWLDSCSYFKMLTARATTSTPMPRDTIASIIISSLAQRLIAETSVGLNAVAVQKASDR